ncbi:anthocyanidin 3-O-glucosyltransferase 7-like [Ipomoea triloba]|uniref:anthocyanidin 3-O-glucosyltransferase 7-like n=1 Tax=Ipomoea triloba TaxID=35885 RepID=UPI00125D451F|nr:anthocyanidin 3-O-glucosyltransferase 7-like [Ipomoea triloba]
MGSSECHVAVLAFPFGTHAAPLLSLVEKLSAAFPSARFSFFSNHDSNSTLFGDRNPGAGKIKAYDVGDGTVAGEASVIHEEFIMAMPGNYQTAIAEAEAEMGTKFGCFLTDAFLWFGGDLAAERGGVPWIALWTAGACSVSAHLYTDFVRSLVGANPNGNGLEQKLKVIPGMSEVSIGEMPGEILAKDLQASFPGMIYNMALKLPGANAVVLNSFQKLDPTITDDLRSKLQKVFNIGPMILRPPGTPKPPISDDHNCIPWLDSLPPASPAVYLSFGSALTPPPDEIVGLAEALEAKRAPFLWSLKPHGVKHLPKGFLERTKEFGKIVSWAPQVQVLSHPRVGAFVTHCGWNSILEAISFGVCMICRPFYGDQQINTRFVESVWEIGVKVEGGIFTKDETMKVLSVVLDSDRGKLLKENVVKLKGEALEAVKPNGSSTKDFQELVRLLNDSF